VSATATARRLFTLSGLAPLGAFLVLHAITNARAIRGEGPFVRSVAVYDGVPGLFAIEIVLVYLPLLFHAAYGVWLTTTGLVVRRGAPDAEPSPYPPRWPSAVRATGVVGALFILVHVPELRFRTPGARPAGGELLTWLSGDLSSTFHGWPLVAAGYLFASACTSFHFAAGSWAVFARSRLGEGDARARRATAWAAALGGAVLWLVFASTVVLHATGARLLGSGGGQTDDGLDRPEEDNPHCPPVSSGP
jgi:succinate dehydrogenase / fumarate reductase cytochrome b subunit